MGIFRRRALADPPKPVEERASLEALAAQMRTSSSSYTYSGANVTLDTALKSAAAWACITRLKSTITSLPVDVIRESSSGRVVLPKASHPPIVGSPSALVSRRAWVGQYVHAATTAGNVYADVVDLDSMGRPLILETISASRVSWINGRPHVDGKARTRWPLGDLWHVPISHLMVDGSDIGMSPVAYGRESIATGMSAEKYGGDFFRSGGMPVGILKPEAELGTPTQEQSAAAKQAVLNATANRGVLALTGWDLTPFNIDPKDTQFLELLEFTVLDACRRWMVPPSMIYAAMRGSAVTYANVTDADLAYLKHSVAQWVVDLEDRWAEMTPGSLVAKFRVDAILRMDKKARTEEHKLRLETKTRTINEVRVLEDEEPFDDPIYDEPGIPGGPASPQVPDMTPDAPNGGPS